MELVCAWPLLPLSLSVTFGVFLCNACAQCHRSLLLEVCSVEDKDPDVSKMVEVGGNKGNAVYEYGLKQAEQAYVTCLSAGNECESRALTRDGVVWCGVVWVCCDSEGQRLRPKPDSSDAVRKVCVCFAMAVFA
jgi:hypothetical protein